MSTKSSIGGGRRPSKAEADAEFDHMVREARALGLVELFEVGGVTYIAVTPKGAGEEGHEEP
jgi:hypothetical protein